MKRRLSVISIMMAFVLVFTCFVGCKDKDDSANNDKGTITPYQGKGVHYADNERTSEYLIRSGVTEYKILMPTEPKKYESLAMDLLNEYVYKSVGIKFQTVYSDAVSDASSGKFISLGDTSLMRKSGISVDYNEFKSSGFIIKTIGDDIYISGARNTMREGTYYGVQEFLSYIMGWRAYTNEDVVFEVLTDIPLVKYDVIEIPEFDHRLIGTVQIRTAPNYATYLRLNISDDYKIPVTGHSHFNVLNPRIYAEEHPDWYVWKKGFDQNSPEYFTRGQLCLGNKEMQEQFAANVVALFREHPETNFIHLGQQDYQVKCNLSEANGEVCEHCLEFATYKNDDGSVTELSYSGMLAKFTNTIARMVTEEIQKLEPDRQLQFEMFAYHNSMSPPTIEKDGQIVPEHPDVVLDDNVCVQFTPMGSNVGITFKHEKNALYYSYLQGWDVVSSKISTWTYATNFSWYLFNYPNWDTVTEDLRMFSEMGVESVYHQNHLFRHMPQMNEMRMFVESQLMWNVSLDYDTLAEEFINYYYGPAAPQMNQMFDVMTTYYSYLINEKEFFGTVYKTLNEKEMWSFGYVDSIRQLFESAYEAIEPLKETNPQEYEKYYWRIGLAYTENLFMQLEYYRTEYGEAHTLTNSDLFESVINRFNMIYMGDGNTHYLSTYLKKWRGTYV